MTKTSKAASKATTAMRDFMAGTLYRWHGMLLFQDPGDQSRHPSKSSTEKGKKGTERAKGGE